jgi:opacity protein-like surface antigen
MAVSGCIRGGRKLALLAALCCLAGKAGAAMPGLYFSGFYMDSTLAYAEVDAGLAGFDRELQKLWVEDGFRLDSWGSGISKVNDIGFVFSVGYLFSQYFSGELGYAELGTVHYQAQGAVTDAQGTYNTSTYATLKTKGPVVSGVLAWPLGDYFSLDARAGVFLGRTSVRARAILGGIDLRASQKNNVSTLMLGAGINFAMSPGTAIRVGYSRLSKVMVDEYDVGSWMVGLKYAW